MEWSKNVIGWMRSRQRTTWSQLACAVVMVMLACADQATPIAKSGSVAGPKPPASPRLAHARTADGPDGIVRIDLDGQRFESGATVTLGNSLYQYGFGAPAVIVKSPTSIELRASDLDSGTYSVSVRNPRGEPSNELALRVAPGRPRSHR
jgi:hypothetical protein